jgi:hypothetical protein
LQNSWAKEQRTQATGYQLAQRGRKKTHSGESKRPTEYHLKRRQPCARPHQKAKSRGDQNARQGRPQKQRCDRKRQRKKTLKWLAVGKRGEKRLIKGQEREEPTIRYAGDNRERRVKETGDGRGRQRSGQEQRTMETDLWRSAQEQERNRARSRERSVEMEIRENRK